MITNPHFIIGLGGIGNAVARLVWQRFMQTEGGPPPTVLIRSIDTAEQLDMPGTPRLPDQMFVRLEGFAANEVVANKNLFPEVSRWWDYDSDTHSIGFIDNGAGARRPLGRLFFFHQFSRIQSTLDRTFRHPLDLDLQNELVGEGYDMVRKQPNVFLVGSVAGGTCSGMLIDMAFAARELLRRCGYDGATIKIAGILALPSVVFAATGDQTSVEARNMQVNAMGALTEIDALQRGWQHNSFTLQYPSPVGEFAPASPLFDYVYLFSATQKSGYHFSDQQDILMRTAHFLYQQASMGAAERLKQVTINVPEYFDPTQRHVSGGLVSTYASFGVEWLEVPQRHLLRQWCGRIAESVAARVAEFDSSKERLRNLDKEIQGRLPTEMTGLHRALSLTAVSGDELSGQSEAQGIADHLNAIRAAEKPAELRRALEAAQAEIPTLATSVRSSLPRIDEANAATWLYETSRDLIRSPAFRIGGAERFLSRFAEQLAGIGTSKTTTDGEALDAVVDQCISGVGPFKRVSKPHRAEEWISNRMNVAVGHAVQEQLGASAARLATTAKKIAELLRKLSLTITAEAPRLAEEIPAADTPQETWMLDPEDVDAAIREHWDEVVERAAAQVADEMAKLVSRDTVEDTGNAKKDFEEAFAEAAINAIGHEAIRHAKRPTDIVSRIQKRVLACEPMLKLHDQGAELLEIMPAESAAKPVRLIMTNLEGEDKQSLEAWARGRSQTEGRDWTYQVHTNTDSLRDDVMHATFGWPLWLMPEVRRCFEATEEAEKANASLPRFNRTHREIPITREHAINPVPEEESRRLFSLGLVLEHIQFTQRNEGWLLSFEESVFGTKSEVRSSLDRLLIDGYEAFKQRALADAYKKYVDGLLASNEEKANFKDKVKDAHEKKLALLDSQRNGLPDRFVRELSAYYARAREFADGILVL